MTPSVRLWLARRKSGVDVVNDGEMSKVTYATYVTKRLMGFDGESRDPIRMPPKLLIFASTTRQ